VEGHRYADEESSWYSGQGQYDSDSLRRPSGAFRLPEERPVTTSPPGNPYPYGDPSSTTGGHMLPPESDTSTRMYRAPEYRPALEAPPSRTESRSRTDDAVYQSRRPVTSFLVAVVMSVLMIPVVRLLLAETFAGSPTPRGIVPAVLLTLGFTLAGIGLFAIARGGPISRDSWLRPPVAYLPAGLILLLAAGLAVA
jgi:hypothetical protein